MRPGERLLSLAARIPATLLPFAAALGLAPGGMLPAVASAAAALGGYWAAQLGAPWVLQRVQPQHVLLCAAVIYVVLSVLLIVAVEQHVLWAAILLSGVAGLTAPPERAIAHNPRLERTAIGVGLLLAVACGFVSAWSVPLVAAAFVAAAAVPVLVMTRAQPPRNSTTADL